MTPPGSGADEEPMTIRAGSVEGSFASSWQAEVLTGPPLIAPARRYVFPRAIPGEEEALARGALELLVRPARGGSFLATCWMGFLSASLPTGVWACPRVDELCAVAGGYAYVVDTAAPEQTVQVPLRPVTAVKALPTEGLLLLAGFTEIVGWGEDGLRWTSGRLSWEGLTMGEVADGRLGGTGWDLMSDRELPFSLDLRTGEHVGGGYRAAAR